jgi:SAM-dependent methyltransferase
MHSEARGYVGDVVRGRRFDAVVEVGGRWINGGVRDLIDCTTYTSLDLHPGGDVDVVIDVRDWRPPAKVDLVICCEVIEHADDAEGVVAACLRLLAPGGRFVMTCAGPGRDPHSALDGGPVRLGEHYANIEPAEMKDWLNQLDEVQVLHYPTRGDLYATGVTPE